MDERNNTAQSTEKKKSVKILAYIGLAVFFATVLCIAFFAPEKQKAGVAEIAADPSPSSQASVPMQPSAQRSPENTKSPEEPAGETAETPALAPFIYEKKEYIFIASGKNKMYLGTRKSLYGCYKELNCVLSPDNRILYYIENTDINTGQGALKSVPADAASIPVTIEDGVCAAEVSSSGSIMYIKNVEGVSGDLYILKDGKSSLIDKSVVPLSFEFSPSGNTISYIVQENDHTFALYIKKITEDPEQVTRFTAEASINDGITLSRFNGAAPFDAGQVLYSIDENNNMPVYFYDSDGKTEKVCSDGYIIKTYPEGDFLYADVAKNNLWYKSTGTAAVNITENYSYSRFSEDTNRFLLMEHIGDGLKNSSVMMYEVGENKEKTAISVGDDKIFEINAAFDCVVYERDGVLYASRKADTKWAEIGLLKASRDGAGAGSKSDVVARFDSKGSSLYSFDAYKCGPLYRFSLKDGKMEKLLDNADSLYVYGNSVYAHASRDKLYRITGSEIKMISEDVRNVVQTQGGAYLLVEGSFKYIADNSQSPKLLDGFTRAAEVSGSIKYRAPLEEDLTSALEILSDEANYCLYKLKVYRGKTEESINISDALAIAQKLAAREDLSAAEQKILKYFTEGFKAYEKNARKAASSSLQKAMDEYTKYLNSAADDTAG